MAEIKDAGGKVNLAEMAVSQVEKAAAYIREADRDVIEKLKYTRREIISISPRRWTTTCCAFSSGYRVSMTTRGGRSKAAFATIRTSTSTRCGPSPCG